MQPRKRKIEINVRPPSLNTALAGIDAAKIVIRNETAPSAKLAEPPRQVWKMGQVVLRRETAHRGGKTVIVVDDFATHLPSSVIERVAKKLRVGCGCGGAVKGRAIEVQGDQAVKVRALLEAEGFQVGGIR
jgi:translation initiation factor 1